VSNYYRSAPGALAHRRSVREYLYVQHASRSGHCRSRILDAVCNRCERHAQRLQGSPDQGIIRTAPDCRVMPVSTHSDAGRGIGFASWPLLGLLAAGLAGTVLVEVTGSDSSVLVVEKDATSAPTPQYARVIARSGQDNRPQRMERILARPLFSEDRRPPAASAAPVAGLPRSLPRLTGIVVSPAGGYAIFAGVESGKPIVVQEGGQVGGAVVEAVAADQVTIRGPDGSVVMRPSFGDKVVQASRPNPALRRGGHDAAVLNRWRRPAT